MKILRLNLKRKWFEQIKSGIKNEEYRLVNDYWRKRLVGREYDEIHLCLGYPKAGDEFRMIKRKWAGFTVGMVMSSEYGGMPVNCFKIDVSQRAAIKGE